MSLGRYLRAFIGCLLQRNALPVDFIHALYVRPICLADRPASALARGAVAGPSGARVSRGGRGSRGGAQKPRRLRIERRRTGQFVAGGHEVHTQLDELIRVVPTQRELLRRRLEEAETAVEGRMAIAEADQREQILDDGPLELRLDFGARIVVAIDVAADTGTCQQLHVVVSGQQSDVINLWNSGQEKLDRTGEQIAALIAADRIEECAVDLVEVEIGGCSSGRLAALAVAALVNALNQFIDLLGRYQARPRTAVGWIGADIDDADAIVGIEHRDRVARPDHDPSFERLRGAQRKRTQNQGR